MYRTIAVFCNQWKGSEALVLGTGPSVDIWKQKGGMDFKKGVTITINRSCFIVPNAEFSFFDTPYSLGKCSYILNTLQRICLPMFSLGKIVLNDKTVQQHIKNIFFYNWDYKGWAKLNKNMYDFCSTTNKKLNLWQLFIENGNVQSIAIFAKMIGCKSIYFVGIDGFAKNNHVFSKDLVSYERNVTERKKKKQLHKYRLSKEGLIDVLDRIEIDYEFCK